MPNAIFEKKKRSQKQNCSNVFGLPNTLCCIKKMGGYAYLKLTNSEIQMRFWVKKNQKLEKLLNWKLKKPRIKKKIPKENASY